MQKIAQIVDTFFGGTHKFAVHISEFEHRINDPLGFWIENWLKILKKSVLLATLTSSNSELRKDFLDRKKVLKSLEANSSISPQNYVIPARYHTKQHPNVWVGKAKIHLHHPIHRAMIRAMSLNKRKITYGFWFFFHIWKNLTFWKTNILGFFLEIFFPKIELRKMTHKMFCALTFF